MTTSFRVWTALLSLSSLLLQPEQVDGRCFPTGSDPVARYGESNFVLHLTYDASTTATIPCGVRTYTVTEMGQPSETTTTGYEQYTIKAIFKQDWETFFADEGYVEAQVERTMSTEASYPNLLQVGDSIALIYSTDTGITKQIPQHLKDDEEGFLAFLEPHRYCHVATDGTMSITPLEPLTSENLRTNPFALSGCEQGNQGWSGLTQDGIAFLNSQILVTSDVDVGKNITTDVDLDEEVDSSNATSSNDSDPGKETLDDGTVFVAGNGASSSAVTRRLRLRYYFLLVAFCASLVMGFTVLL